MTQSNLSHAWRSRRPAALAGVVLLCAAGLLAAAAPAAAAKAGAALTFTPAPYDYGKVTVGQTAAQTFTLTNTGTKASGGLTVTVPGSAEFTVTADTCTGISLGAGKSCTTTVRFAATAAGTVTATLTAASNKALLASDALTGTGSAPATNQLYWNNDGPTVNNGTVNEANLDGSNAHIIVTGQNYPRGIAVDSNHIYWAVYYGNAIAQANRDGTAASTLLTGTQVTGPEGVAVDSHHVYWSDNPNPASGVEGTINEANLDGTGVTTLVTGQGAPGGVAVDTSHIYWTDGHYGAILRANLDGTGVTTLITGQSNLSAEVAVDSNHIYWENNATVMDANLDGTGITTLVTGQSSGGGVAVDNSHIYWTDAAAGTINEANLDGTGVTTLVTGQSSPTYLAVGP